MFKKRLASCLLLFFISAALLCPHGMDEIIYQSTIVFDEDHIRLRLNAYIGPVFGTLYINTLDPEGDGVLSAEHIPLLSELFLEGIRLQMDGIDVHPRLAEWTLPAYGRLTTGLYEIRLVYHIPYPVRREGEHFFLFENMLDNDIALYTLAVLNNSPVRISILDEERSLPSNRDVLSFSITDPPEEDSATPLL